MSLLCVCSESLMVVNLNSGAEEEKIPLTSGDTLLGTVPFYSTFSSMYPSILVPVNFLLTLILVVFCILSILWCGTFYPPFPALYYLLLLNSRISNIQYKVG